MTKKQQRREKQDKEHLLAMIPLINKHIPRRFMDVDGKIVVLPGDERYADAPYEERIIPA